MSIVNRSIASKIALAPLVMLLLSLGVTAYVWVGSNQVADEVASIGQDRLPEARIGQSLIKAVQQSQILVGEYLSNNDPQTLELLNLQMQQVNWLLDESKHLKFSEKDKAQLESFYKQYNDYYNLISTQFSKKITLATRSMQYIQDVLGPDSQLLLRNLKLTVAPKTKSEVSRISTHIVNVIFFLDAYYQHRDISDKMRVNLEIDAAEESLLYLENAYLNEEQKAWLENIRTDIFLLTMTIEDIYKVIPEIENIMALELPHFTSELLYVADHLMEQVWVNVQTSSDNSLDMAHEISNTTVILSIIAMILGVLLSYLVIRSLLKPICNAVNIANGIAAGDLEQSISSNSQDETGQLLTALNTMQGNLKNQLNEIHRTAGESQRIKTALDNTSSPVMMSDKDHKIIYINNAMKIMFEQHQSSIKQDIPEFDASNVNGSSIQNFHKHSVKGDIFSNLTETVSDEFTLGDQSFSIAASPVNDDDQQRVGTVVEWQNKTAQLQLEDEVKETISQAKLGNLNARISMNNKTGFFETLSQEINGLIDVNESIINETVSSIGAMAQGQLNKRIESEYFGSYAQLKKYTNTTIDKLTSVIVGIKSSSSSVHTGAQEISTGNTDLSQRTEMQASNIEESASSMEEITANVKNTASNAHEANALATEASGKALEGGEVLKSAVSAMTDIKDSAQRIHDIISVIDDIAFQTNLLALNASVEAAHAGDQGQGFAVVANEVRSLAQRCATAAKEIKGLINDSVEKVDDGSKLVNKSGDALTDIIQSISKVSSIINEISLASDEQSTGIEAVNQAIAEIDTSTQHNAALVEETAAASENLGDRAQQLQQLVAFFTVDENAATGNNSQAA
jgi:methyl-accepting chemotaxis protein